MGNPLQDAARDDDRRAGIRTFYSPSQWMEGNALHQLDQTAALNGVQTIAAFPDLHPGKYGPVGCAILADRIYPHLIGNDIGCGMSVFLLDMPARKVRVEKAAQKMRALEGLWQGDAAEQLHATGLTSDEHNAGLGSIGGGNHFCELQAVETIFDEAAANSFGLSKDQTLLLVHSGSRSLGAAIFAKVQEAHDGLEPGSHLADDYLQGHDRAVAWASLNRSIIAQRAAEALRADHQMLVDCPHNLVEQKDGMLLHRKGAARADLPLVPLAGSRDGLSFLLQPTVNIKIALNSLAHGAGRKYDRKSMHGRVGNTKSERDGLVRTSFGGRVVCEDRQLLLEEAPAAYKDPCAVVDDLEYFGLVTKIAALKPLVTFKKAAISTSAKRLDKRERLLQRRRDR